MADDIVLQNSDNVIVVQDSDEEGVYEIKNLVIHGGRYRAMQSGYGCDDASKVYASNPAVNNPPPIQQVVNTDLLDISPVSVHGHGIPAFTMWLRVEDFYFDKDGHIGATISRACMRKFPMYKGMWGGRNDNGRDIFNNISFPRHAGYPDPDGYDRSSERVSVSQGSVPDVWKDRDENGNIIYHGYDYATNWIGWGCYFNVYASIYYGNVNLTSKVPVFSFPGYNQWGGPPDVDDAISGYPFVGITKPITLQSPEPVSESILLREENRMKGYEHLSDEEYKLQVVDSIIKRERKLSSGRTDRVVPVTLVIYNNSQCSCDQTNKNRPVFAADITQYIPDKKGYVWRRFGSSATEDPEGSAIAERMGKEESELLDGEWHLVRPFFYKSGSEWVDVEKDVEL